MQFQGFHITVNDLLLLQYQTEQQSLRYDLEGPIFSGYFPGWGADLIFNAPHILYYFNIMIMITTTTLLLRLLSGKRWRWGTEYISEIARCVRNFLYMCLEVLLVFPSILVQYLSSKGLVYLTHAGNTGRLLLALPARPDYKLQELALPLRKLTLVAWCRDARGVTQRSRALSGDPDMNIHCAKQHMVTWLASAWESTSLLTRLPCAFALFCKKVQMCIAPSFPRCPLSFRNDSRQITRYGLNYQTRDQMRGPPTTWGCAWRASY